MIKGKIRVLDVDNYKKSLEENKIDAYIKIEEKNHLQVIEYI